MHKIDSSLTSGDALQTERNKISDRSLVQELNYLSPNGTTVSPSLERDNMA